MATGTNTETSESIPFFGARRRARELLEELKQVRKERDSLREVVDRFGGLSLYERETLQKEAERDIAAQRQMLASARENHDRDLRKLVADKAALELELVQTGDVALLQECGIYEYQHPLADAVAYQGALAKIEDEIKTMCRKDGGAILATTNWSVNGSATEGRAMVRDFSKLMLRAFNAEADSVIRSLRPHRLPAAIERVQKVAQTIERLGKTMHIRVSPAFLSLRTRELRLTSDFLHKQAAEKEAERVERERLREERKVQQEIERERARLEKERQHYVNARAVLVAKGDLAGEARLNAQLAEVDKAINDVDFRAANIRAGYVYVISNIGSFGERMVKVGMTRRLDPMDRIRELSDASVPFNFDVHALFFSKDAVGIESAMHERLVGVRVNTVNRRREFFRATPAEVKAYLTDLAGELLQFQETPEALEYRQCLALSPTASA